MPLSEDEQRILRQIEEQFYESDPKFAQQVGTSSIYRHALRNAAIPVITVTGPSLGFMLSGAVIIETVFSPPTSRKNCDMTNVSSPHTSKKSCIAWVFSFARLSGRNAALFVRYAFQAADTAR